MKVLFIINDAPYGSEKAYNALRLAMAMQAGNSEVEPSPEIFGQQASSA